MKEKFAYGDLFITYEKALICRVCGKIIHRFGHGQRKRDPHAEKHFKEGKVRRKYRNFYNSSRGDYYYYLKDGVETIDPYTLILIKVSIRDDPKLCYAKPDIEQPFDKCPTCGSEDITYYWTGDQKGSIVRVKGWECRKCGLTYGRDGTPNNTVTRV